MKGFSEKTIQAVPLVLKKIDEGYTPRRACESVGISYTTLVDYCVANKINFKKLKKINMWRRTIREGIVKKGKRVPKALLPEIPRFAE